MIGNFVLVRTLSAGVHCGELVSLDGKTATLKNARRVWRWQGANTLHELAKRGADKEWTRISEPVDEIVLTEAIELIPCTPMAQKDLGLSRWGS
jgi:hypothetical protein